MRQERGWVRDDVCHGGREAPSEDEIAQGGGGRHGEVEDETGGLL